MRKLINTLWPIHCLFCDSICINKKSICDNCYITFPIYKVNENCINHAQSFDNIIALFNYAPPISSLITKLKFQGDLSIAKLFSQYWIDTLLEKKLLPELIIPVPLHYKRLKERGFNQALEIAKPIGKYFKIPVDANSCIRIKNTKAQSSLPAKKRMGNVDNAFRLATLISAKHVAILDDVMTTGNTVSEMSHLLKKSGVVQVDIWCCARA